MNISLNFSCSRYLYSLYELDCLESYILLHFNLFKILFKYFDEFKSLLTLRVCFILLFSTLCIEYLE